MCKDYKDRKDRASIFVRGLNFCSCQGRNQYSTKPQAGNGEEFIYKWISTFTRLQRKTYLKHRARQRDKSDPADQFS